MISEIKKEQRKALSEIRKTIINREQKQDKLNAKLLSFVPKVQSVFIYVSFGTEMSTHDFISSYDGRILVPLTVDGVMELRTLDKKRDLHADRWGNIARGFLGKRVSPSEVDVAIVPMLGFNKDCYRLGYGGGYYDRFLADFAGKKIGIAFDEQLEERIAIQPFDVPLDVILTPQKTFQP